MRDCQPLKKQKLTKLMKAKRQNWAKKFQIWTAKIAKGQVSNQCTLNLIMVWSVMTVFGTGRLHIVQGNM